MTIARPGTYRLIAILAVILIAFAAAASLASPVRATTEHCPDGGSGHIEATFDGQYDDTVLAAGTLFCVKGSTDATGILVADGETSLFDYLDNGHNVSYYVTYQPEVTPSPSPTPTPEPTPTPTPTPEPTPTPTPSSPPPPTEPPSTTPTPTPTPEPTPTPATPSPELTPTPDLPEPTLPPTDMSSSWVGQDGDQGGKGLLLILAIIASVGVLTVIDQRLNSRSR